MGIGLAKGVWYNGANALITGAGIVAAATATGAVLYLGWAMIGLGALLFGWGITVHDEHWWSRSRIKMTWPYALIILSLLQLGVGAFAAVMARPAVVTPQGVHSKPKLATEAKCEEKGPVAIRLNGKGKVDMEGNTFRGYPTVVDGCGDWQLTYKRNDASMPKEGNKNANK